MRKKLLIAVDDARHAEAAVRYAVDFYQTVKDVAFVLLHVQPSISDYLLQEAKSSPKAHAELERVMNQHSEAAHLIGSNHKARMVSMGIPENAVQIKTMPRNLGAAKDILEHSQAGQFDGVVLGRRGLAGILEVFAGSVSSSVVENSAVIPVWLVDGTGSSRNIMLAVDGSESSFRAVDHLAFMLDGATGVRISLFHVTPRLKDFCAIDLEAASVDKIDGIIQKSDRECIDRFLPRALERLGAAGIDAGQIDVKVTPAAFRVGKSILDEYRQGDFGTLIVGRRGMDKAYFTGSVSRYLINHFSDGTLWVVP